MRGILVAAVLVFAVMVAIKDGRLMHEAGLTGGCTVIHVPIDPKANSEEMPKYEKFRTWYAAGTQ